MTLKITWSETWCHYQRRQERKDQGSLVDFMGQLERAHPQGDKSSQGSQSYLQQLWRSDHAIWQHATPHDPLVEQRGISRKRKRVGGVHAHVHGLPLDGLLHHLRLLQDGIIIIFSHLFSCIYLQDW